MSWGHQVDYSESNLDILDADLMQAERRRDWMSGVAMTLRAKNQPAQAAERQHAHFAAMAEAMRDLRARIEQGILARRENAGTD